MPSSGTGITLKDFSTPFAVSPIGDPRDRALLHLRQGDLLALKGQWAGAQTEYEKSVKNGGGLPALRKLAQAQLQRRNIDGARATIRALKAAGARSEDVLLLESIVALRSGELSSAQSMLQDAQDSPQKHFGLALLHVIRAEHPQAQQELKLVTEGWEPVLRTYARSLQAAYDEFSLFPESTEVHLTTLIARALAQVHECELALPLLGTVTQSVGDYRDAWIVQGYCELTGERYDAAVTSLEHAYTLDPSKPETQYFLARAYSARGEHQNAITFLEYALQNGFVPQAEIHRAIAEEATLESNPTLARDHYAILITASDASIEDYAGYITTTIAIGSADDAYTTAQAVMQKFPDDATATFLLGIAEIAVDKKEEAKAHLRKALELNPSLTEAEEKLKELE